MVSVNIYRRIATRFGSTSQRSLNVTTILDDPGRNWSDISSDLKNVDESTNDLDEKTHLGSSLAFVNVFRDAMRQYTSIYSSSKWCRISKTLNQDDSGTTSDVVGYNECPIVPKTQIRDPSFAQKVVIPPGGKVVIIGDIHSGLYSFVEIIDDLVKRGILDQRLYIKWEYHIVFLGDILDRGPFGLDILNLVFKLKTRNFNNVHIVNGNHEDEKMYRNHGFGVELDAQIANEEEKNMIRDLLTYLPSVIFMRFEEEWYQLNHGGIQDGYDPSVFMNSEYEFEFHGWDQRMTLESGEARYKLVHMGLRWNDFDGNVEGSYLTQHRGPGNKIMKVYGKGSTEDYLRRNNIQGIVRGHQDFFHSAIMRRTKGSKRDLSVIPGGPGMIYPAQDHWSHWLDAPNKLIRNMQDNYPRFPKIIGKREMKAFFESKEKYASTTTSHLADRNPWQRVLLTDAFMDFSVFTTSTAVRARGQAVGYHTYLELTGDTDSIQDARDMINENLTLYNTFASQLDMEGELYHLMHDNLEESTYETTHFSEWLVLIQELKSRSYSVVLFPLLVLDSMNTIIRPSEPSLWERGDTTSDLFSNSMEESVRDLTGDKDGTKRKR